jgi:hypothetical protein
MTRRFVLGILIALVLVAGAVTVGVYAYQFGVTQGIAQSDKIQVVAPEAGTGIMPYYPYGWGGRFFHPFGFFGCFGFLLPLLFFFLLFGLVRRMLWGGWGWRGGHHGWGHRGWQGEGVPPPFEEWHKRAHGQSPPTESTKTE